MTQQNPLDLLHDMRPSPWGLRGIALHPASLPCAALRQLIIVAEEKRLHSVGEGDREATVLLTRLVEWPLPILARCATVLHQLRDIVRGWIDAARAKTLLSPPLLTTPPPAHYQRLYNICLWQRRHPLFILTSVLDTFGARLSCEALNDMLEALSHHLLGSLASVPHLLRGDVFMTYPRLPFPQQLQLMESFRTGYASEKCEAPPPPELYLGEYMRHVPPRFGVNTLNAEQYAELRCAFELHKRAGVRRLFSCTP
ncbi:hypothetical protein TRSC58_01872 [Trypanosoma rangeli SC58]|uniref:Uncharacterized protein n=1 Tax=Trypanosoma rangeli SC58 TaxID=429131 RepID=A0A061JAT0_TRYRA|nr:hypothetical protein TRSC58_01872 [Trypanosoma rangeli SC58]